MHKVFTPTIVIVILSSIHCQQPVLQYTNQLRKAVPHHWENDQEKFGRRVDQIERGHQVRVGARGEHPLRPHHKIPWLRWVQEGRFAKQAHKDPEIQRIRTRLLEEKLKPNHLVFKPHINPQLKPKLKSRENVRTKRDIAEVNFENKQKQSEQQIQQNVRLKREAMMSPQLLPEMVMQPHIEAAIPQPAEQEYQGRIKESEKRDKRELFYFINPPPQLLARIPRTTPNPFIRETNIEDYDIIKPDDGERTGVLSNRDSSYTDLKSYPLMNEELPKFANIISQLHLTTSTENWPKSQHYAENDFTLLSDLVKKIHELNLALQISRRNEYLADILLELSNANEYKYKIPLVEHISEEETHRRLKRRVNKTKMRKTAKKKKQRQRRIEAKRLRMLTHARRLRKQQKSKQARLQRHYARMNLTIPEHLRNRTLTNETLAITGDSGSKIEGNENEEHDENVNEESEEYETSEYDDESETDEEVEINKGNKSGDDYSDATDKSETEDDSIQPDNGNDDYKDYHEDSEDEDENSNIEEVKNKNNNQKRKRKVKRP